MAIVLEGPTLCMENLHAKGPFHYWQRLHSFLSLLNSSSGRVDKGRVAFPLLATLLFCLESARQFERPR